MRVVLASETDLVLADMDEPVFEVSHGEEHVVFGALQMFITSLGLCTYAVLASYGEQIEVEPDGIRMRLTWEYLEKPVRIGNIVMEIDWPGLPESRLKAAQRAAAQCTIHNTLHDPPLLTTRVKNDGSTAE